jgi:hypothetical protein
MTVTKTTRMSFLIIIQPSFRTYFDPVLKIKRQQSKGKFDILKPHDFAPDMLFSCIRQQVTQLTCRRERQANDTRESI